MRKKKSRTTPTSLTKVEPPTGIYVAELVDFAKNTAETIILTFAMDDRLFKLFVRSRHDFAPPYGGPSFTTARIGARYVLAVRKGRGKLILLEYALPLDLK